MHTSRVLLRTPGAFAICVFCAWSGVFFSHSAAAAIRLSQAAPTSGIQGATLNLSISGEDFVPAATTVRFSGSGVVVNGVRVLNAGSLLANVTLSGAAGIRALTVSTTAGTSNSVAFEILPSPLSNSRRVTVSHLAGPRGGPGTRDGRGEEARFMNPQGLWADSNFVYVADQVAHTIRRISIGTAEVTTLAGAPLQQGFVNGIGASARLTSPGQAWGDGTYLYFLELGSCAVRRAHLITGEVTTFAGRIDQCGITTGTGEDALFRPSYLSGDGTNLFVVNGETCSQMGPHLHICAPGKLSVVSLATREVQTIDLPDIPGRMDSGFSSTTGSLNPSTIWTDNGDVYLSYAISRGVLSIGKISIATGQFQKLSGFSSAVESGDRPTASWPDGHGGVYFTVQSPYSPRLVQRADLATGQIQPTALLPETYIDYLTGIWGAGDNLFVADAGAQTIVRIRLSTGGVTTLAGLGLNVLLPRFSSPPPNDPFPADRFPGGAMWSDGEFMYTLAGNAVYRIRARTGEITLMAGSFNEAGSRDGRGSAARFWWPDSVWGDGTFLYIADNGAQGLSLGVRRVEIATGDVTTFFQSNTGRPSGIWGDGSYLYLADGFYNVWRISLATREVINFAGKNGSRGFVDAIGAEARFSSIAGLWGDDRYLYASDACAIRRIELATAQVVTVAGDGTDCRHVDGPASLSRFKYIYDIWGDGGTLFVESQYTVRAMNLATGETRTLAGDPEQYGNEDGQGPAARFGPAGFVGYYFRGLWGDGTALFAADHGIRKITPAVESFTINMTATGLAVAKTAPASVSAVTVGYARLQPVSQGTVPQAVAIFSLVQNGILVSETSVPASAPIREGRIYAEVNQAVNTGLAIANPNDQPAVLSFYFTDSTGSNFGNGTTTIPANGQIAAFLNQLPFYQSTAFGSAENAFTFTFTSSVPVAAIAVRGLINERLEFLMTTLPVSPLTASTAAIVIPQVADGGGWQTQVLLVNPSEAVISGTAQIVKPNGETQATFTYTVAPRSSSRIVTAGTDPNVIVGSIRIRPDTNNVSPVASTVFSFKQNGITVTESGVAGAESGLAFRVFAEKGETNTGIALSNNAAAPATVQFELFDSAGQRAAPPGTLNLPANGQLSLFLSELSGLANLPDGFQGVLRLSSVSGSPVSVIGLRTRVNQRGEFLITPIPPISESGISSGAEFVFPHIVTGAGYRTEFVFLGRTGGSVGRLLFRTQSGTALLLEMN